MTRRRAVLLVLLSLAAGRVAAYETNVHAILSLASLSQSKIATDPSVLAAFGVSLSSTFPNSDGATRSVLGLVVDGSVFEDTKGVFPRPLNHFFDPTNGAGLLPVAYPSPAWALEDAGAIDGTISWDQKFSFRDARTYFYEGLTLPKQTDRDDRFGKMFQSLGHVIHHLQDMAQPQHVRADPHLDDESWNSRCFLPISPPCAAYQGIRNPSLFERYTRDHPDRAEPRSFYAPVWSPGSPFDTPRSFWQQGGKGIAEFTNRNFLSDGTNFGSGKYALPAFDVSRKTDVTIAELCALFPGTPCPSVTGTLTMFGTTVGDALAGGSQPNDYASTLSLFDADLARKGRNHVFSLNRFNFEAALRFLVPRAVGYSAGLLDYFFRASIDLVEDPDSRGFLVRNASPDLLHGTFALHYDAADDTRKPVPGARWTLTLPGTSDPKKPVSSQALDFAPPPDAKTKGRYVLVFDGDEGAEVAAPGARGAVAGRIVNVRHVPEGLFVAGLDAAGQTVYLRADASGTHVVASGEFNPLLLAPLPSALSTPQSPDATRFYKFRQVAFGGSPPGYRTTALAFKNKPIGTGLFQIGGALVYDAANRRYAFESEASWAASSPDPAVGRFVFTYHVQTNAITYRRAFVDAAGVARSSSGLVAVPSELAGYNVVGLTGIDQGKVFVSPDGLSLSGFATQLPTVRTPPTSSIDRIEAELRLTLTDPPAATLVTNVVRQVNGHSEQSSSQEEIGQLTTTPPPGCYDPRDAAAYTCTFPNIHFFSSNVGHQDQRLSTPIGWFDGALASYTFTYAYDIDQLTDYTGANCSMGLPNYAPYGCCPSLYNWVRSEYGGEIHDERTETGSFSFADGSIPAHASRYHFFQDQTLHYEGCRDGAPGFPPPETSSTSFEQKVRRALTPRAADALTDARVDGGSFRFHFRGMDVTGLFVVADGSPAGEVFFATSDKSIVIHEPRGARMPQIVIPPHVVTLVAAIWM